MTQVLVDIPQELEAGFRDRKAELSRVALESMVLEGIRQDRISVAQGRRILGIESRYEMDGFLKAHDVMLSYTLEEIMREVEASRRFEVPRSE
ncbi:MAG: UPF0175 family protein [Acidobacteria bacterium]|nr:UPF0175 family protein [Acidobacteriota bacterium]